jgi:asparagine synthase (glutamine-hydrolysing)
MHRHERWSVVFNGEIYNYRALRDELAAGGASFRGGSDTEVLLEAVAQWGVERALLRFDGMFALALWDAVERRLWLARDRIGEKPLYYVARENQVAFASELKSLRLHPLVDRVVDRGVLALYFRFGHVPSPHCIYSGVRKLPPGHFLRIEANGNVSVPAPYWRAESLLAPRHRRAPAGEVERVDEVEAALRRSVADRVVADVPLGALLSGGIDSSLVVALMQAQSSRPVKTFTIGYEGSSYSEAKEAAAVARHLGTEHHEHNVTSADALAVVERLPEIYDEPFADSSQIPTFLVSRFAREHVTVALSGDAGDELFCGYNRYLWTARMWPRLARMPRSLRRGFARSVALLGPTTWTAFFDATNRILPDRYRVKGGGDKLHKLARAMDAATIDELYRDLITQWREPASLVLGGTESAHPLPPTPEHLHFVERLMFLDLNGPLPDDMLCKVDRAAMATALEVRVPFLANEVVSLAWSLSFAEHTRGGVGKRLLREVLARHVPRALFERPKVGFGVPIGDWLRGPLRAWGEDQLAESRLRSGSMLDPVPVRAAWRQHLAGSHNHEHRLWSVLMFLAWQEREGAR